MDKHDLSQKIKTLEGLTDQDRADLLTLLNKKRYGLVWEDKPEAIEERLKNELPILQEVPERAIIAPNDICCTDDYDIPTNNKCTNTPHQPSLFTDCANDIYDNDTRPVPINNNPAPNHILIEGDNLEALTALAYTHAEKIDVIYIDPPYNTGNKDFVYNDRFVDAEDQFRHSKWLSFMQKRLHIAKKLLSPKGVIFISIDDNEQAQLKLLCDEIFGEENFVATIPWRKRTAKSDVPFGVSQDYEWIICYAKTNKFIARVEGKERKYYETPDFPNRPWRIHDMTCQQTSTARPNSFFTMINPKNGDEYPCDPMHVWRVTKDTFQKYYNANEIIFPGDYDFLKISRPVIRYFKDNDMKKDGERFGFFPLSTKLPDEVGMNQNGTKEIKSIFGELSFSFPKSVNLIKYLIKASTFSSPTSTILDFFAGSGTTLHATMQLNAEDGGSRQCILVTNNENGICEQVTYERNRRVIQGYTNAKGEAVPGLTHNNLRYYRTGFVGRERTAHNMRQLVALATDMLCIKEDNYNEQTTFCGAKTGKNTFRYFECEGNRLLIIYDETEIENLVQLIANDSTVGKISIYVFSPSDDPWRYEFESVANKVELCALPQAIYNAYKNILPTQNR